VTGRCGTLGCPYDEDGLSDALLVASELTSNAILHGGGVTGFDVDVEGRAVSVSVCDRSDRLPVVADRCRATGTSCDRESVADALLVASELTTNAILHGGGVTDFRVDVEEPGVRVSVSDRSDAFPVTEEPVDPHGRWRVGGRGWPIVCRLARDVRITGLASGGKCITAVVPLS
jgi:anti-sigma regulatory factor (Ser/Thr protein kinase)